MTIKIKKVLEYNLYNMNAELQFAKVAIIDSINRLKDLMQQRDFASYHSESEIKTCINKLAELSEILQKLNRIEADTKYFKNKTLLLYKELKKTKSS